MSFLKLLRKHILLILFFAFAFGYGYSLLTNQDAFIYLLKPFIVPSLILHYIAKANTVNIFFIIALFFAFTGDLLFNIVMDDAFLLAMSSFVMFNFFIMIIVAERAGEIKINNFLISIMPFLLILFIVINYAFNAQGTMSLLLTIYGGIIAILSAFCLYFYLKTKGTMALYFLIGSLFFIVAGISKGLKEFDVNTFFLKVLNNISYTFSLYFYYKAMMSKHAIIDNSELQSRKSITY